MSALLKPLAKLSSYTDPLTAIAKNNPDYNSRLGGFLAPGPTSLARISNGEGVTPKVIGDPAAFFSPTEAQQQKTRADAQAAAEAKVMPLANDQELALARRRAAALQLQRGGRASTILTGTTDSLGG